ncbi:PREDICTED: LOW QUALITY PROTEIN: ATP-dependent DNA helicase 2 subunit KU70 [Fragaria vesca subsp. vesca]|uniref:LOW QUALITY PROTEIN: ATP-dependent DNA helicase 2 subunit KU70 n=1 Tax=Fragaria vesca subsp. vesca TaxID=101020 RepID=UPI0002C2EB4C|nr:PREDICTED: LOW QUALITY PROTEIN: ATP-dependent DNA helicase 2 subunit KU70 [Fragaria vesca subsp. vesca]
MEYDADDIFRDDEDDSDNEFYQERASTKELVVYLVDASPKMFSTTSPAEDGEDVTDFHVAMSCISESLRKQIINSSYDEVAVCFFNTREKRNLQDLNGVYVFNVDERDNLDRPTARLIKEVSNVEESFMSNIGSQYGINSGSRENSLYNALWVAQALLHKGSARTADKRVLLFTNEDDPFGSIKGIIKTDMMRTTLQRAKDAQDLGISIELLPLCHSDNEFNVSTFYSDLIGLTGDELAQFMPKVGEKLEDMKDQLRRRMFKKRIVRKITFSIANGLSIQLSSYALVRPTNPGAITWLDSVTNRPLKGERSLICTDTGALVQASVQRVQPYKNENIKFSVEELSEIKRISTGQLRLLGFKPLNCLKEFHNLRPSTFVFPSDQELMGSTCVFIALHKSMLRLKRFAVAFYGSSSRPQLVALVAQEEIVSAGGQVEPPGMHMIYLPYSDDIRHAEELLMGSYAAAPHASDDQITKASALINRLELKDFSVFQFSNPGLQRHYAILQALALDEDDIPEIKDETFPPEEGMSRPAVVRVVEEFKHSVYGENYDEETDVANAKASETTKKRKAAAENAVKEIAKHDWADLADNGKLKNLTVMDLKCYLTANNLPVAGKKEALISRILTHMGK